MSAPARVLVTGYAGFIGQHLIAHLRSLANGPPDIIGFDLRDSPGDFTRLQVDLTDAGATRRALEEVAPDAIVHLAGVTHSTDIQRCFAANVLAAQNLLATAAALPSPPIFLSIGSAAQYGIVSGGDVVVDEDTVLAATTPYGLSKAIQEQWTRLYADTALRVVCVRLFNVMGPGQTPQLVPATFLSQVTEALAGKRHRIEVGNTATCRDFVDVRDVVRALWLLLDGFRPAMNGAVYNVASGQPVRIHDMVEAAIALGGRSIPVHVDPVRLRRVDVPSIVGCFDRLRDAVGWRPTIAWRDSLRATWNALP